MILLDPATPPRLRVIADYFDHIDTQTGNTDTEVQQFCRDLADQLEGFQSVQGPRP